MIASEVVCTSHQTVQVDLVAVDLGTQGALDKARWTRVPLHAARHPWSYHDLLHCKSLSPAVGADSKEDLQAS